MLDPGEVEFVIVIIGLGASWRVREKEKKMVVRVTWHFGAAGRERYRE